MSTYDPDYRGARFYKCDLHMHTPADVAHWQGAPMGTGIDEHEEAARAYIRRCYEEGLEVIAVTDHNLASRAFIPLLQQAINDQKPDNREPIVLFPGFELQADVGKGLHVLAIFEPSADLVIIDHVLTECGVAPPRFKDGAASKSTKNLRGILSVVQKKNAAGGLCGLVICPHAQADAGIFDGDKISEWLQQEEFINPDLLCLEVPKPVEQMSAGWQKLMRANSDCHPGWRRRRSIACIRSSDTKDPSAGGAPNTIGSRYTWVKMSAPSIEALRQAFLDHDSRIRLTKSRPEDAYGYPRIRRLAVSGMRFVADQTIALSPNLTTIIGGRGTGKSSLVEYLRVVLSQEESLIGDEPRNNFVKLRATIQQESQIQAVIEREGKRWTLMSRGGQATSAVDGTEIVDLRTLFPVQVLSQREVYSIAEDGSARNALVDDVIRPTLDELHRSEADLRSEIEALNRQIESLPSLRARRQELDAERQDRQLRLDTLRALAEPLSRWRGVLAEQRVMEALEAHVQATLDRMGPLQELAALDERALLRELEGAPNQQPVEELVRGLAAMTEALTRDVGVVVARFRHDAGAWLEGAAVEAWRARVEAERQAYESLRARLLGEGTDPEHFIQYERELRDFTTSIAEVDAEIESVEGLVIARDGGSGQPGLISTLFENWRESAKARQGAAEQLTSRVPKTTTGQPFVTAHVHAFGDFSHFHDVMQREVRDGRRITAADWDDLVSAVFSQAMKQGLAPGEMLRRWMQDFAAGLTPAGSQFGAGSREASVLLEWLTDDRLQSLRTIRTPDRLEVNLFREDGSHVGELAGPELSVGQRCTAVLALLLTQDDRPIVIDQPEEDLDNEFVYQELVPLLRRVKERRQVIVVSHNANIPVNADSELVVALEVRDQQGKLKVVPGLGEALGALDRAPVKKAVEIIMEGSEEAFRRRQEKYGF